MKHLPQDVPHIPSPDNCFVVNYQANLAAADISCRHCSRSRCLRARRTPLSALSPPFTDLVFSFLIQCRIVIIIRLQYDVSDCWKIKSCFVVFSFQRATLWWGKKKCHSWIFLCFLESLNSHMSGGGFYAGDYVEHVSHQSRLNLMQGIKTLPFQEAIQG